MINVTKTYLPSISKYKEYIDKIYESGWITNNGPLTKELEKKLAKYLGVKNIILVSNGTAALEVAYRTLELEGDVITTPFSFVATTSSLVANGLNPIFADIDKDTLNINHKYIQQSITKKTKAIVPVHVFGNACEVEKIQNIANKNNLKVIYDAAHAFDVKYKKQSILNYGDISVLSFHATKLFHTIEGGALIINDDTLVEKARQIINFGMENNESIPLIGINAKMNEFEAAMGLLVLEEIEEIKLKRKKLYKRYINKLENIVKTQAIHKNSKNNFSYFPIILKNEASLKKVQKVLNDNDIFPRRYFYPSLDTLKYIKSKQVCKISRDISKRILCLPIYPELDYETQDLIIDLIKESL